MKIEFSHKDKLYIITFDGEKYNTVRTTPCCGKEVTHSVSSLPNLKQILKKNKDCIVCSQNPGKPRKNRGSYKKGRKPHNSLTKFTYVVRVYRTFIKLIEMFGTLPAETHLKTLNPSAYHAFRAQFTKEERTEMMLRLKKKYNVELSFGYRNNDGVFFRGFYEFIISSFLNYHNVNVDYHKYIPYSDYLTDGYFSDFDVWWEHYGDLNKNNDDKNSHYKSIDLILIKTSDMVARKLSFVDLYKYFLSTFNTIIGEGHNELDFNEICKIIEDYSLSNTVENEKSILVKLVKEFIVENGGGIENQIRNYGKGHESWQIIHYMNKYFGGSAYELQKWLNEEHNFNFKLKLPQGHWQNKENCLDKIKEIIKTEKCLPSQTFFWKNGLSRLYKMISVFWGGMGAFRRNTLYEGEMISVVYDILGEENTPYDLVYDWTKKETYIESVKKINSLGYTITTAQSLKDLKVQTNGLTTSLLSSLNPKNNYFYTKFNKFKEELL